jgi:hypothetical protein
VAAVPSGTGVTVVVAGESVLHVIDPASGQRMPAPAVSGPVRSIASWPGVPDVFAVMLRDGTVEIPGEGRLSVSPLMLGLSLVGVPAADGRLLLAVLGPEDVTPWDVAADRALGPYLRGPTLWPAAVCGGPGELVVVSNEHCRLTVWDLAAPTPAAATPGGAP